jgi:predicted DNA-binding transcriptional regulator AlpA
LAELTGLQVWRVHELVKKGDGPPSLPIGRTFRFPEDGVLRWIEQRTTRHQEVDLFATAACSCRSRRA